MSLIGGSGIFLFGDLHALALDIEPQAAEETHIKVCDPDEREKRIAAPAGESSLKRVMKRNTAAT